MTDKELIIQKLNQGMYQGNMHLCLRDIGRLAGGYLASGRLTSSDCDDLGSVAERLANNKKLAKREWQEAVDFGKAQPIEQSPTIFHNSDMTAVGWDEVVNPNDYKVVDAKWLEKEVITEPTEWSPCKELAEYINLLYLPTDIVAYCTDPFQRDDKWIPSKGTYTKTAKEILKSLKKNTKDGFDEAVGTLNNETSGAWIRINPFDGNDVKDANVTDFRYALIECDAKPIDEQVATYRQLELPCVCIVHSGSKSAHAIVRVNAQSLEEYRKRVNFLYEVCNNNGLPIDTQNRNPSRYSRMPGVLRNGKKQFIIARNIGKATWDEWENWIKDLNDDLPDFETLTEDEVMNPPQLAPELISGVLRVKHKMIISGPSKAGKSFLLIELAICIAEGLEWLGHQCAKGKVLYVNLELDRNSCTRRFADVYKAMKTKPSRGCGIDRWNLRGRTMPLDALAPKLIRRASGKQYDAIIIDPIYKVLTGDENSASDMAKFCNLFDRIGHDCGSAIIFCHHHSKGSQGDKKSADRASGSGVFARDPDAIMDVIQMDMTEVLPILSNQEECSAMLDAAELISYDDEWKNGISGEDRICANRLIECFSFSMNREQEDEIRKARAEAAERCKSMTGWMVSLTLREFATPQPFGMFFKYPLHVLDEENYLLECKEEGASEIKKAKRENKAQKISNKQNAFKQIVELNPNTKWTVAKAMEQFEVSKRTVFNWLKSIGWHIDNGVIITEGGKE